MNAHFLDERQLLDLGNDIVEEEKYVEDVELEVIDVVTWEQKNELWRDSWESRLEVRYQHHDSPEAVQWARHRT